MLWIVVFTSTIYGVPRVSVSNAGPFDSMVSAFGQFGLQASSSLITMLSGAQGLHIAPGGHTGQRFISTNVPFTNTVPVRKAPIR